MEATHQYFYEAGSYEMKTDTETLSRYWSIRSANLSFTHFEVPPHQEFKTHRHLSEQITYVLCGELYFEIDDAVHCLRPGDSIVIPSDMEHRVWTTETAATAVDAWSPPFDNY